MRETTLNCLTEYGTGPLTTDASNSARFSFLAYGRHEVDDDDVDAVVEALRSEWLTTGPRVEEFERLFAARVGAAHAVAVNSGTAALHAAMHALGVGPGDEVIVPALTFVASANCAVYQQATPVFADVDAETLLLDPREVERLVSPRTRAVVAVDYAGQTCDYDAIREAVGEGGINIVADACHAIGGADRGRPVGSLADVSCFSFHAVKTITSAEGGMLTTDDAEVARAARAFRNHGITTDHRQRAALGTSTYEMVELGYNYRLSDVQCALGISQLRRLDQFVERRRALAARYDTSLAELPWVKPLACRPGMEHGYHLYVVRFDCRTLGMSRDEIVAAMREQGIGVGVHYPLPHLQPFYRTRFGTHDGQCRNAERAADEIGSLPLFPAMKDEDVDRVVQALRGLTT